MSEDKSKTVLGIAWGSENDELVHIEIDRNAWEMLSDLERTALLFHELSHDILNASHDKGEDNLMHPTSVYDQTIQLLNGMAQVFVDYKNGDLKQFDETTNY